MNPDSAARRREFRILSRGTAPKIHSRANGLAVPRFIIGDDHPFRITQRTSTPLTRNTATPWSSRAFRGSIPRGTGGTIKPERMARWAVTPFYSNLTWPAAALWARLSERMARWAEIAFNPTHIFRRSRDDVCGKVRGTRPEMSAFGDALPVVPHTEELGRDSTG